MTLPRSAIEDHHSVSGIPGVISHFPNCHVATIRGSLWSALLKLIGKEGERIMLDLLLECGIFLPIEKGENNFYQLSGKHVGFLNLTVYLMFRRCRNPVARFTTACNITYWTYCPGTRETNFDSYITFTKGHNN